MVETTRAVFTRTLIVLAIAAAALAAGCSRRPENSLVVPPASVNSEEVPILVFWDGQGLRAVPDKAHLKNGAQRAHWVAVNGDSILTITYKDGPAIGLNDQPECRSIHCEMKVKPQKMGKTDYSITLTTSSGTHRMDPQLIVD